MRFVDEATIYVKAGKGGDGICHFARTRHQPRGGPDGGDGGKGGDVVAVADSRKQTLLDFKYKRHFKAEDGNRGGTNNKTGRSGKNVHIKLPLGTKIYDLSTNELIADLLHPNQKIIVARGGKGGLGNTRFASSTNRIPTTYTIGEPGEEKKLKLSLELIAEVGLVGLPNAGKSTLLSTISDAKPKVADYPFTTINPVLGVVKYKDNSFVVADLPGLIEGASQGKGLGFKFLKHLSRVKVLCHLVDITQVQSESDNGFVISLKPVDLIEGEIYKYSQDIANKPKILVFTKIDLVKPQIKPLEIEAKKHGFLNVAFISSATREGLDYLKSLIVEVLNKL